MPRSEIRMQPELFELMLRQQREHWWFRARRKLLRQVLRRHLAPGPHHLLEAGCGTGGNLAMLAEFGTLQACESDPQARAIAIRDSGMPVLAGALPDALPALDTPPDCVALLDVLEHIEQDGAALAALAEVAADHSLLLTVPAFPLLWSRHDETHGHYRRYRRRQLMALVEANGWQVTYCSYFNVLLFLPALVLRLWHNWRGSDTDPGLDTPPGPINRLLEAVFLLEWPLVGRWRMPFGLSLMLVARRRAR